MPEVLYHWRKTSGSTASTVSAKTYAIAAGVAAVQDHLERRGLPARVSSVLNATMYRVEWKFDAEPKITIIIPFRDHIEMTRRCLDHIRAHTDYHNFEVILVDNWSTSPELGAFVEECADLPHVRILRVEEDFNYSRLNNLAVAQSDANFYMFLNNDVFIDDPHWLRTVVNEALADDKVGIVGGKFVYPNQTVQHAGVILGLWGVAGHSHTGIAKDDPGYSGRAVLAHEVSAVTAAGMLARARAFREVGGIRRCWVEGSVQ